MSSDVLNRVTFEENSERTKVVIPLDREWPFWITYTIALLVWLGGTIWAFIAIIDLIRNGFGFGGTFLIAYFILLLILAGFWLWVGRMIWRRWQYYHANREILFFYDNKLIVRRPISLLGVTDAYDRNYVSPLSYDKKVSAMAFDYGTYRIPVGGKREEAQLVALIETINDRFFNSLDSDKDDEELAEEFDLLE